MLRDPSPPPPAALVLPTAAWAEVCAVKPQTQFLRLQDSAGCNETGEELQEKERPLDNIEPAPEPGRWRSPYLEEEEVAAAPGAWEADDRPRQNSCTQWAAVAWAAPRTGEEAKATSAPESCWTDQLRRAAPDHSLLLWPSPRVRPLEPATTRTRAFRFLRRSPAPEPGRWRSPRPTRPRAANLQGRLFEQQLPLASGGGAPSMPPGAGRAGRRPCSCS